MSFRYEIPDSLNLDGWSMNRYHQFVEKETRFIIPIEKDFIGIYINTGKAHQYKIDGFRNGIIHKERYNLLFIPAGFCELSLPEGNYSAFCIEFTPEFFKEFISGFITTDELRHTFLKHVHSNIPASLSDFNATATSEMMEVIRVVTENPQEYTGELHQMVLHSKMIDLVARSIVHIQDQSHAKLSNIERIKIKRAHDHLLKNINCQVSMKTLSEVTGMDKQTFEERFEILYGKSIPDFLRKERMKKAISMLRDTTLPLSDIRLALGYKNVRLFSKDFLTYYGYSARVLRKEVI